MRGWSEAATHAIRKSGQFCGVWNRKAEFHLCSDSRKHSKTASTQCPLATLPFSPPWRDSSHSLSAHICLPLRPCTRSSEPDGGGSDPDRNRPPSPTDTQTHKPLSNQPQHSQSGGRVWQVHLDEHRCSRINQSIPTDCRGISATYAFVNCAENVDKGVRG